MYNIKQIYTDILKEGISEQMLSRADQKSYGKIIVATSKKEMMNNTGFTCSSIETLYKNVDKVTHFTPNVYRYLHRQKSVVSGHSEENLKQINAFVVDIDNPGTDLGEIMCAAIEKEIIPTLVLKTEKGFHLYYVLDKPVYVSKKTKYRSLQVAKRISSNLRLVLSEQIKGVDLLCNHFGYFRCPNHNNVVAYHKDSVYSFKELMQWSKEETEDRANHIKLVFDKEESKQRENLFKQYKQIKSDWYGELIRTATIHAGNGYGRNNAIFTLSLANYQSDVSYESCLNTMDEFNTYLEYPLSFSDVERIVKSAYSGKYKQATKEYVQDLLETWTNVAFSSNAFRGYYKHKKQRKDRIYSHAHEREDDIIQYINQHAHKGYLEMSLRDLAKVFDISITALRNALKQSKKVKVEIKGKGRYARTLIYTAVSLLKHVQNTKIETRAELEDVIETVKLITKLEINGSTKQAMKTVIKRTAIYSWLKGDENRLLI